jgi:hypothetical protein
MTKAEARKIAGAAFSEQGWLSEAYDKARGFFDEQDCTCADGEEFGPCWYRLTDEEQIEQCIAYLERLYEVGT